MNDRLGHRGTLVELFVAHNREESLQYFLEQGATVEQEERPILQAAEIMGKSDVIKALLIKHGATR